MHWLFIYTVDGICEDSKVRANIQPRCAWNSHYVQVVTPRRASLHTSVVISELIIIIRMIIIACCCYLNILYVRVNLLQNVVYLWNFISACLKIYHWQLGWIKGSSLIMIILIMSACKWLLGVTVWADSTDPKLSTSFALYFHPIRWFVIYSCLDEFYTVNNTEVLLNLICLTKCDLC